ncbi:MAG: hypothetical protein LUG56_06045 [Lachnospiraceae bacterium]|nr:hypothetical protein [Lachnospiraceae bacterium]
MMTSKKKTLAAAGMTAFFTVMILAGVGVCFETNDDRIFVEFLSGSLTGSPDAHAIYLNYLLSWPLMVLYRVTPSVPWYGLFLIASHCTALFLILRNILAVLETKEGTIRGIFLCVGLLLADIYLFSQIQFTSTAALLAIAGYSCVLSGRRDLKRLLLFLYWSFWPCCCAAIPC